MNSIDLTGTWTGPKGNRTASIRHATPDVRDDGTPCVTYVFSLDGAQTGIDGGAGCSDLSYFLFNYRRIS